MKKYSNIGCVYDQERENIVEGFNNLQRYYNIIDLNKNPKNKVDIIIVLGGDGFLLHSLHKFMSLKIPFFGMNFGNVGFLLNIFDLDMLLDRISKAKTAILRPLKMRVIDNNEQEYTALAINEVSLLRESYQAAHIKITIDNEVRMEELVSDGILLSTPAGSSAYNLSAGGPILPLDSNILALTPISPFRPRRWKGALLNHKAHVEFDALDNVKRPVSAVADFLEFKNIKKVVIEETNNCEIKLLFDQGCSLEERLLKEQFAIE